MKFLLLLAVIAAAAAFLLWRRGRGPDSAARGVRTRPAAADERKIVRFRAGPNACAPARQQAGRHVPAGEMPRLPLPGCRAQHCRCRFEAALERRVDQRRKQRDRRESIRFDSSGGDRRKKDRRRENADPWGADRE